MAFQQYIVSDVNPNDTHGGGGCVCDPAKQVDCKPPYVVVYGNEMESAVSPHVVICAACAKAFAAAVDGEVLSAGERGSIVEAAPVAESVQAESPVVDDDHLIEALRARDEDAPEL